jgi:uncharacterized OB-fold protein
MAEKNSAPAIAGWYTLDPKTPHLIGTRCKGCGSYYFPKQSLFCRNPDCQSSEFDEVELSRTGKIWSYTDACYKPPEPFIAADPFVPYAIAAVELEKEKMIVLGQVVEGVTVEQLCVGQPVELVLETLFEEGDTSKLIWKWKPLA